MYKAAIFYKFYFLGGVFFPCWFMQFKPACFVYTKSRIRVFLKKIHVIHANFAQLDKIMDKRSDGFDL